MPNLQLRSERQIQTELLSSLISGLGLNDISPGSVIDVLTQAIAQQDFNVLFQVAQLSRLNDIEFITGNDLDTKAFEYGLARLIAQPSTGLISTLRPAGFVKVSTNFSGAVSNPIVGSTFIDVNDASNALFASAGTLVLGRGTNNNEEVAYSAAPMDNTSFWRILIDSPLVNNHAIEETVILKQGIDETILAGEVVRVLANGVQAEVQFTTDNDFTLLSGEDRVDAIGVTATAPGALGNIPSGAITGTDAFPNPPFSGARAENSSKFTTGRDLETDEALRDRIKTAGDSLTKGVKQAILNATVGLVDPDSAKRVVSASVVLPIEVAGPVKVYIDDGTGFEPEFESQGFETIRANSTGGETRLQLDKFPIQKATIESIKAETYDFSTVGLTLLYQVGILQETITFDQFDFSTPDIATAEAVVSVINDKASLIEARTSQVGKQIIVTAKADVNEDIQILGGTANAILVFPTDKSETVNLYLDDVKLSKDGVTASLDSQNTGPFNLIAVGAFPHTLTLIIDGKTANVQTATLQTSDVADTSAVTVAEILTILVRDISGMTSTGVSSNANIRLISNTLLSVLSKIEVTGGTMNDAANGLNFSTTEVVGRNGDFTFNRELGLIDLATPLTLNQTVTGGSLFTRAKLRASLSETYVVGTGDTLIVSVDGGADQIVTFDASFTTGQTAATTATFINVQLSGATAVVRAVGGVDFLEIRTNTFALSGSLEIKSTSTANSSFQFTTDLPIASGQPNSAFRVSQLSSPYLFAQNESLIVVVDNNTVENTFSTLMSRVGSVTGTTSVTDFADAALNSIFQSVDEIKDYRVAFTSGANTTSETITTVTAQGGDVFRYTFNAVPPNFADFTVGDIFNVVTLSDAVNNGDFIITAKGAQTVDVTNAAGVGAVSQGGVGTLGQLRLVSAYNQLTGGITVNAGFVNVPALTDGLVVFPNSVSNVVDFLNNIRITPLSLKVDVEGVANNTRVQIASKSFGSDGFLQIPASPANVILDFETTQIRGAATYRFWTGLLALVHKTLYGDDADLTAFPGVLAAGITAQVLAPTVKELTIEVDVTLSEGVSAASLDNELKSRIGQYVNSLGVGEDLIAERIRAAVINVTGVVDVTLTNPSGNVAASDNEILRVADPNIFIG